MKNIILLLIILIAAFNLTRVFPDKSTYQGNGNETRTKENSKKDNIIKLEVDLENQKYLIYMRKLKETETVKFIPNYEQKLTSTEIANNMKCDFSINGGFYKLDGNPLGLLVINGRTISKESTGNLLLNGFVSKEENFIQINKNSPTKLINQEFAFQSGPFFDLTTENNARFEQTEARRSLIMQDKLRNTYFMAITDTDNSFSGPKLEEIKNVLDKIGQKLNIHPEKALNLDGGSTLTFLQNGEESISELRNVGGLLCVR